MIHKVQQLTSIGKFRAYQATGDVSFQKLTLVYADNGGGKTTLASVFRSLTQNRADIIERRLSINPTTPQAAQIIQRDQFGNNIYHTFRQAGWSNPFPHIEVFDVHFVNDNIYSGFDFSDDQKKELHDFVIGAQGVELRRLIERNKEDKAGSRQTQTNLENDIIQQIQNGLTAELMTAFLNITDADALNIDNRIAAAEIALANARANAVIQSLQSLSRLNTINAGIDFGSICETLQTTSQIIQDQTLRKVFETHCADLSSHAIEGPEGWIRTGYGYLEKKAEQPEEGLTCPFCQRGISNDLEIFRAYALRFDAAFNALVNRIQAHITFLEGFTIDLHVQSLKNTMQTNVDRAATWVSHLPANVQAPASNVLMNEPSLRAALQEVIALFRNKAQNPSAALAPTAAITLKTSLETLNSNIAAYNQEVGIYNNAVEAFRAGIKTELHAQNELLGLKRIKGRMEPRIGALCTQLSAERQKLRDLEQVYPQLIRQQETAAAVFFSTYKEKINHYLGGVFKTPFRIENVCHVAPKGKATRSRIEYNLTIGGHIISYDPAQPTCARDCLSEGDKSTIALAFFFSKLDIDPMKSSKILVLDDPLSSFDSNRRGYTVQLIKDLLPQIEQVIVLSHNEFFLSALSKGISRGNKKSLRILENFTTNSCEIKPLDLDTLVEAEYFRNLRELEDFLSNPDINKKDRVLGLMRNVLEAHIRFKFYRQTRNIPEQQRTFGKLIEELVAQNVLFRSDTIPPSIISRLRLLTRFPGNPTMVSPILIP